MKKDKEISQSPEVGWGIVILAQTIEIRRKQQMPDNLKTCQKLINEEKWTEAVRCFKRILQRNNLTETEIKIILEGFRQARMGEEAAFYLDRAREYSFQDKLDNAIWLLDRATDLKKDHDLSLTDLEQISMQIEIRQNLLQDDLEDLSRTIGTLDAFIEHLEAITKQKLDDEKVREELAEAYNVRQICTSLQAEDWLTAQHHFEQYINSSSQYLKLATKMKRNIQWGIAYSNLLDKIEARDWNNATKIGKKIIEERKALDLGYYKNVFWLLMKARWFKWIRLFLEGAKEIFSQRILKIISVLFRRLSKFRNRNSKTQTIGKQDKEHLINVWTLGATILGIILGVTVTIFAEDIRNLFDTPRIEIVRLQIGNDSVFEIEINDSSQVIKEYPHILTGGERVPMTLKKMFDHLEGEHTPRDFKCRWTVNPYDRGNIGLEKIRACQDIPYTPSLQLSEQTVTLIIESLHKKFKPIPPILIEFDIENK